MKQKQAQLCSIGGCDRKRSAKGMCNMHYSRVRKTGEVGPVGTVRVTNRGKSCKLDFCEGAAFSRGYCSAHYQAVVKGAELRPVDKRFSATVGMTPKEKLDYYSSPPDEQGCVIWKGPLGPKGYPAFGKEVMGTRLAHRVAYMVANDEALNSSTPVHHACSVRLCVEPSHLQAITSQENTAEMLERRFYRKRIELLEAALRRAVPGHPLIPGAHSDDA